MGLLEDVNIHSSWEEFLTDGIKAELKSIEQQISNEDYTPDRDCVLRFLGLDLNNVKVVILGQDPYKPYGVANGRSFQPADLINWKDPFRQVSLKNIVRLIYKTYNNIEKYTDIPKYSVVAKKIDSGEFDMRQPEEWFDSLEEQGVLFLNASLTCRVGESNSHRDIWENFTSMVISYIARKNTEAKWFLWGKEAQDKVPYIVVGRSKAGLSPRIKDCAVLSRHPMMCSEKYEDDFLKSDCFKVTMNKINWLG